MLYRSTRSKLKHKADLKVVYKYLAKGNKNSKPTKFELVWNKRRQQLIFMNRDRHRWKTYWDYTGEGREMSSQRTTTFSSSSKYQRLTTVHKIKYNLKQNKPNPQEYTVN